MKAHGCLGPRDLGGEPGSGERVGAGVGRMTGPATGGQDKLAVSPPPAEVSRRERTGLPSRNPRPAEKFGRDVPWVSLEPAASSLEVSLTALICKADLGPHTSCFTVRY